MAGGFQFATAESPFTPTYMTYVPPTLSEAEQRGDFSEEYAKPRKHSLWGGGSTSRKGSIFGQWSDDRETSRSKSIVAPPARRDPARTFSLRSKSVAVGAGDVMRPRGGPIGPPVGKDTTDSDIIIVTVRLHNPFRDGHLDGDDDLPNSRPAGRNFMRRMSTRLHLDHSAEKENKYKAVKMPRGEYKRHFARDAQGNYAGTEPRRSWTEDDLMNAYGMYQERPIDSTL